MADTTAQGQVKAWSGGDRPMRASYGKLMMWFFLVSDALTFGSFLITYGVYRVAADYWPDPDIVFNSAPFLGEGFPLVFVGIMTFILIASSLTMVLAVDYGHQNKQGKVIFYMVLTIIGGIMFLSCQAWEWTHLMHAHDHQVMTASGEVVEQPVRTIVGENYWGPMYDLQGNELTSKEIVELGGPNSEKVVRSAGPVNFGNLFFTITGFHGFHVFSGVIILIIVLIQTIRGVYQRKQDYEMIEKVGLYWHFVDLVWVFVFTFFYLV